MPYTHLLKTRGVRQMGLYEERAKQALSEPANPL